MEDILGLAQQQIKGDLERKAMADMLEKRKPLAQRIAEAREAERKSNLVQKVRDEVAAEKAAYDPTEGMSTGAKLGAGFQSGLRNIGRNVGNMVGVVSDDELAGFDEQDAALLETGAGGVGAFAGEMAGLAPLGALGGGAAKVASALPNAMKALRGAKGITEGVKALGATIPAASGAGRAGLATAALEGAGAGAVLGDANERGSAALTSGLLGGGLNKTIGALGRKFTHGIDEGKAASEYRGVVEKIIGRPAELPVAQATDKAIPKFLYKNVAPMFPFARGGTKKMLATAQDDWTEAVLKQGLTKDAGKVASEIIQGGGTFQDAVEAGLALMNPNARAQAQKVLRAVSDEMTAGDKLTPQLLDRVSKKFFEGQSRPFYELSGVGKQVFGEAIEESTVSSRKAFNEIIKMAMPKAVGAGLLLGAGPSAGTLGGLAMLGAGSRAATSRPLQKFVQGRSVGNKLLKEGEKALSPYAAAIRNTIAGQ